MLPEFRLIIAGDRGFTDFELLRSTVFSLANFECERYAISLVSGMSRSTDALGPQLAHEYGIKLYEFPANWDRYGKRAGYLRNEDMGHFADGLLAFWDGESKETKHMIDLMERMEKPVHIVNY